MGILLFCWDAMGVFYYPSRLGCKLEGFSPLFWYMPWVFFYVVIVLKAFRTIRIQQDLNFLKRNNKKEVLLAMALKLPLILEIWRVQSIPSLLFLTGQLWSLEVVPVWVPSMNQIDVLKLFVFHRTVCKKKNSQETTTKKRKKNKHTMNRIP